MDEEPSVPEVEAPARRPGRGGEPCGERSSKAPTAKPRKRPKKRRFSDPGASYAKRLERYRPGLVAFTLDGLASLYGRPVWERRLDPTSELILTILTQNSADINAEVAFEALRHAYPGSGPSEPHNPGAGWGGTGLPDGIAPDWSRIEFAPLPELIDVIRPGGLGPTKAPRLQATLRHIREERGDYSLEFLGDLTAIEARDWLTRIDGIGKKTASVLLLFCFGQPLMPIDRHVERVMRRVGVLPAKTVLDEAHDLVLGLFQPDQMYEAHVNFIQHGRKVCHAQRPNHAACPLATRCRFFDPKAP
jgi:endonuclease-3